MVRAQLKHDRQSNPPRRSRTVSEPNRHQPVMLEETCNYLQASGNKTIVDATMGEGGHTDEILSRLDSDGMVIGFERDPDLVASNKERYDQEPRVTVVHDSYQSMNERLSAGSVDGVLFDFGLSSYHLDRAGRGFSYQESDATLDCRFDPTSNAPPAWKWLEKQTVASLAKALREQGGVGGADNLSEVILGGDVPRTAGDLRRSVEELIPSHRSASVLAKVFQVLRLNVNDELRHLQEGLDAALEVLNAGGRLVCMSYHSGEDRLVKQRLRQAAEDCVCPPDLPVCACDAVSLGSVLTSGTVRPTDAERSRNPRARSARLRAFERSRVALESPS